MSDLVTLISALSSAPAHVILILAVGAEAIAIKRLFDKLEQVQAALDDCLKK